MDFAAKSALFGTVAAFGRAAIHPKPGLRYTGLN
jgi:hypothetical protein